MFDPSRLAARARSLLLCIVACRGASAQTVAEYTHRADSLVHIWQTATRERVVLDSVRSRASGDTLRVGNFAIVTDSLHASLARAAAERASPAIERAYGAFATRLRSHVFVLRARSPRAGEPADSAIESGVLDDQGIMRLGSGEFPNANAIAASWRGKASEMISHDLPPEIWNWVNVAVPTDSLTKAALNADRIELILSPSQAAHDCATGSAARCLQALGLSPVAEPAFDLFNDAQRRDLIERNAMRFRRADPARYSRCTIDHIQATCDSIVRDIPFDAVALATPPTVRRSLLRFALHLGGSGSFDRLAGAKGSVGERIAAAAKAPIDSVVQRWQQTLMYSRSSSTALNLETAASALFWAAACCTLALRSSRWR
jgi:hypothetical protein